MSSLADALTELSDLIGNGWLLVVRGKLRDLKSTVDRIKLFSWCRYLFVRTEGRADACVRRQRWGSPRAWRVLILLVEKLVALTDAKLVAAFWRWLAILLVFALVLAVSRAQPLLREKAA